MDQQLPQILFLSGRSPDPRKPPFHQQFQNQRRVAPVVFLGAHLTGANLRCISDPHVVPLCRGHFHKPLTVPGGLHPDKSSCGQLPIKPLGFSRPMLQLLFSRLSSDRVQPTNLLPTGVVITSNKDHRRLLSTELLRSSNQKHTRPPIGAFALIQSNPSCLVEWCVFEFSFHVILSIGLKFTIDKYPHLWYGCACYLE